MGWDLGWFLGEAFVVVTDDRDLTTRIREAAEDLSKLDWRLHDLVITPVDRLDPAGSRERR